MLAREKGAIYKKQKEANNQQMTR